MAAKVKMAAVLTVLLWAWCLSNLAPVKAARESDNCDTDESVQPKRLCRKVQSLEQYYEKMVDIYYKTDRMFGWFNGNKDWLQHNRLNRMMKKLLKKAASLNPTDSDDDGRPDEGTQPAPISPDLEAKMQLMAAQLAQLEQTLNQTRQQVRQLQNGHQKLATKEEVQLVSQRVDQSSNMVNLLTDQSGTHWLKLAQEDQRLEARLNQTESTLEQLKKVPPCRCSQSAGTAAAPAARQAVDDEKGRMIHEELDKVKVETRTQVENLRERLETTLQDLDKTMNAIRLANEGALHNFSSSYQDKLSSMFGVFEDRMFENSRTAYDVIVNATTVFGEDLQMLRNSLSNTSSDVQFLLGQDKKNFRGFEDLRSANRRHEANIQSLTSQLAEFRNQMQDQLNSIRNNFMQSVQEFYNKIVDRQNQFGYRLTSIVDDLSSVKTKLRNFPTQAGPVKGEDGEDAAANITESVV